MKHAAMLSLALFIAPVSAVAHDGAEGPVQRSNYEAHLGERFAKYDTNGDGFITTDETKHPQMIVKFDSDKDGKISLEEYRNGALARFDAADANKDGVLTPEEKSAAFKAHDKDAKPKE